MPTQFVQIVLDSARHLRYRHNDLADMEAATGRSLEQLMGMKFHGARMVLLYGLRWEDRKLDAEKVGNLIQDYWLAEGKSYNDLADKIEEALIAGGIMPPKTTEAAVGNASPEAAAT